MLEDVNDEIPLFTEREQETVLEGEPIGTKVTQVNAIDKDGTFPNNQVSVLTFQWQNRFSAWTKEPTEADTNGEVQRQRGREREKDSIGRSRKRAGEEYLNQFYFILFSVF